MSEQKLSPFLRPLMAGAGFFVFFCVYLLAKGRELSPPKLALIGGWVLFSIIILAAVQFIRKKAFGWIGSIAGVLLLTFLAGALMLSLKTGPIFSK